MAIVVTNPTSASEWKKGTQYTIRWTGGSTSSPITIDLYKNSVYIYTIVVNIIDNYQWLWTPTAGLVNGLDYQIRVDDGDTSDFSDEFFIHGDVTVQLSDNLTLSDSLTREVEEGIIIPTVTTKAATNVGSTTARLNGQISNDGGEACQYRFRYKKSGGSYSYTSWTGSKTTGQTFYANIGSLSTSSLYYFNAQAKNSAGESAWGNQLSFTTKPTAIVVTNPMSVSKWKKGTQYTIQWTGGDGDIDINLYKNGIYQFNIVNNTSGNSYPWTPGTELTSDTDYQIRVNDDYSSDYSDNFVIYSAFVVQLNENLGLGDSVGREFDWVKVLSDNLTLGDSIVIIKDIVKILSDNLTLSDSIMRKFDWVKVLSDDLTLSDSILYTISGPSVYPRFSSMLTADVTLDKGLIYPYNKDGYKRPIQEIGMAVGGAVKIFDLGNVEHFWNIAIEDNETKRDELLTFFHDINYRTNKFTFYPEGVNGLPYVVRLVSPGLDYYDEINKKYIMKMTLRKEIS